MSKHTHIEDSFQTDDELYLIVKDKIENIKQAPSTTQIPECLFSKVEKFVDSFAEELAELQTSGDYNVLDYHNPIVEIITNILAPHYPDIDDKTISTHISNSLMALDL